MPFDTDGVYTPASGAEDAAPGVVIASATWNAIFTDIADSGLTVLGSVFLSEPTVVTSAGPFTITDETLFAISKAAPSATVIDLPAVATRANKWLLVVDYKESAGPLTFNPDGSEKIMNASALVVTTGHGVILIPSTTLGGWLALSIV